MTRWHDIVRNADDCDALYSSGIARVGCSVYVRLHELTTRSEFATEGEAIDAYIAAEPTVSALLA